MYTFKLAFIKEFDNRLIYKCKAAETILINEKNICYEEGEATYRSLL